MIHTVRAGQYKPFFDGAKQFGIPIKGIPEGLIYQDEIGISDQTIVSVNALWKLANQFEKREKSEVLATQICSRLSLTKTLNRPNSYFEGASLLSLLRHFCVLSRIQSSVADFRLDVQNNGILISKQKDDWAEHYSLGMETFFIQLMINVARSCVGKDWVPSLIHLTCKKPLSKEFRDYFGEPEVRYGSPRMALFLSSSELSKMYNPESDDSTSILSKSDLTKGDNFIDLVRSQIRIDLYQQPVTIEQISKTLGMKPRTLQRKLETHGIQFRKLVALERDVLAKHLLANKDCAIQSIAEKLRYKHSTHFARAFVNFNGVTPFQYRMNL